MSIKNNSKDRRIIKSKNALKEALISLMNTKDFKEITITDIVQIADLNRGTFYKHYQYKEDILEEIIDDVITHLIDSYRKPYKDKETFDVSQLSSNAIHIFDHVLTYSNFYSLIVQSNVLSGFHHKIYKVIKDLILHDLTDYISTHTINKELLASYHSYAIMGIIIEWIENDFKYSSNYMAEQLLFIVKMDRNNLFSNQGIIDN
ncbi:TetR/AcrR family transcriptional regulator C-terminal domain-containing protein [Alkalihalobacillus sp. 1P02AB]|uniref:TetR/AcrR family transcriptional regulator n=1 Tax=Alkalihalobacillus sp. 1P02AB TaxID=3132260 RepID=UPI0039A5D066